MKDLNTDFTFPKPVLRNLCIFREHVGDLRNTLSHRIFCNTFLYFPEKKNNPKTNQNYTKKGKPSATLGDTLTKAS